jgi:hypothetical protein
MRRQTAIMRRKTAIMRRKTAIMRKHASPGPFYTALVLTGRRKAIQATGRCHSRRRCRLRPAAACGERLKEAVPRPRRAAATAPLVTAGGGGLDVPPGVGVCSNKRAAGAVGVGGGQSQQVQLPSERASQ